MIEDQVKQTRCNTCEAEHEYKQARVPAQRRKKDGSPGLPAEPGAIAARKRPAAEAAETMEGAAPESSDVPADEPFAQAELEEPGEVPLSAADVETPKEGFEDSGEGGEPEVAPIEDDGPVHRRLIRATLPRPEGQQPERKLPEFTMHQREVNGNRAGRGPRRPQRQGQMRTQQHGTAQFSRGQRPGPRHGASHGGGQGQQGPGQQGNRPGQGQRRKRRR